MVQVLALPYLLFGLYAGVICHSVTSTIFWVWLANIFVRWVFLSWFSLPPWDYFWVWYPLLSLVCSVLGWLISRYAFKLRRPWSYKRNMTIHFTYVVALIFEIILYWMFVWVYPWNIIGYGLAFLVVLAASSFAIYFVIKGFEEKEYTSLNKEEYETNKVVHDMSHKEHVRKMTGFKSSVMFWSVSIALMIVTAVIFLVNVIAQYWYSTLYHELVIQYINLVVVLIFGLVVYWVWTRSGPIQKKMYEKTQQVYNDVQSNQLGFYEENN